MSAPAGNIGLLRCTPHNDGLQGVFPFSVIANLKGETIQPECFNGLLRVNPLNDGLQGAFPFSVIANLKGEAIHHNGMIFYCIRFNLSAATFRQ
ncbi:MAG: hypothetical protein LBL79_08010 [Prevotella sp.]|nr:hypothetical protein [Prevotella sp.]